MSSVAGPQLPPTAGSSSTPPARSAIDAPPLSPSAPPTKPTAPAFVAHAPAGPAAGGSAGERQTPWSVLARWAASGDASTDVALDPSAAGLVRQCLEFLRLPTATKPAAVTRLERPERTRLAESNLAALSPVLESCETLAATAAELIDRTDALVARDGNIVLRPRDELDVRRWRWVRDHRAEAAAAVARLPGRPGQMLPPVLLLGLAPGWLATLLAAELAERERAFDVFRRGVHALEPDAEALAAALTCFDLRPLLAAGRARVFSGPAALRDYAAFLNQRPACVAPTDVLAPQGVPRGAWREEVVGELAAFAQRQNAAIESARRDAAEHAERLDPDRLRARLACPSRASPPLRVLVVTSRHTTFLRHAAHDLARAAESLGVATRVLMEPDASSIFTPAALPAAIADFAPDLLLSINYPRPVLDASLPPQLPVACWLQDAMPHLFAPHVGRALSPLDLLFGHTFADLFARCGYPASHALPTPVPASAHKFHAAPADAAQQREHACDVVFISHHGEAPEALRQRLARQMGGTPAHDRLTARFFDLASQACDAAALAPVRPMLREATERILADELGRRPGEADVAQALSGVVEPLLGRLFRHQALGWARRVCARRGWSLRVRGRGWAASPLADCAGPTIEHDEPLRAAYQCARVTLHLDPTTLVHQRVLECVLSGGLPVVRFHHDALARAEHRGAAELLANATPVATSPRGRPVYRVADAPSLRAAASIRRELGLPSPETFAIPPEALAPSPFPAGAWDDHDATRLFPDLAALAFHDEPTLERALDRAIGDAPWRHATQAELARRVSARLTHEAVFSRLLAFAAERLGTPCVRSTTA